MDWFKIRNGTTTGEVMHTKVIYEDEDERISIIHNGDWSGMATITVTDKVGSGESSRSLRLPGQVVLDMAYRLAGEQIWKEVRDSVEVTVSEKIQEAYENG